MVSVPAMEFQRIEVRPLTPTIGAEIHGVVLAQPLDEATFAEIHARQPGFAEEGGLAIRRTQECRDLSD